MRRENFREKGMLSIKCNNFAAISPRGSRAECWHARWRRGGATACLSPHYFSIFSDMVQNEQNDGGRGTLLRFPEPGELHVARDGGWRQAGPAAPRSLAMQQ